MAMHKMYDILREKAASMGHAAANLPDNVWQRFLKKSDDKELLREAKLYVETYMMGNLEPAEFARVMAEDDNLRYTISDLCRIRLESTDLELPDRNNNYVDVGAGVKTFWREIRVPLPSEIQAARDIRNINFGIEAGRATAGKANRRNAADILATDDARSERHSRRRSLRDILDGTKNVLDDAKRRAAEKAIEKLTPIAESEPKERPQKEKPERKGFFRRREEAKPIYDPLMRDWLDDDELKELDKWLDSNDGKDWLETDAGQRYKDRYTRQAAQQIENITMNIEAGKDMNLQPDERKKALEAAGISTDKANEMSRSREDNLFTAADMAALNGADPAPKKQMANEGLRSGYSADDLNKPLNKEMQELFDQIMQHVSHDNASRRGNAQQAAANGQDNKQDKGRINGMFEGQQVSFKGSWSGHEFTKDEAEKLLAGETISITYNKNNEEKTATGKLEWQEYEGRKYLGFKADFSKQASQSSQDTLQAPQSSPDTLFDEADEDMMRYYMGDEAEAGFDDPSDDYYAGLAEDMANYQSEEQYPDEAPEYSEEDRAILASMFDQPELTDADCAALVDQFAGMQM